MDKLDFTSKSLAKSVNLWLIPNYWTPWKGISTGWDLIITQVRKNRGSLIWLLNLKLYLKKKNSLIVYWLGWMVPKTHVQVLIRGTCECYLSWEKDLCKCDSVKDLERGLSWIIQVESKSYHMNRQGQEEFWHRHTQENTQKGGRDHVTTEAEFGVVWPETKGRWKKQEMFSPLKHQKGVHHCPHLDSDFWPPKF